MSDQLLTIREVGELLSLSRTTIHELVASGRLPSLKIGRARRIPQSEVDRFIADRLEEAGAA